MSSWGDSRLVLLDPQDGPSWAEMLSKQRRAVADSGLGNRPWTYWEWHNPFSRAAACVDGWAVLDLCQSRELVDAVATVLGDDIVLFDSQLMPNPALDRDEIIGWRCDADFFPLDGPGGVTARVVVDAEPGAVLELRKAVPARIEMRRGRLLLLAPDVEYRVRGGAVSEFVVRYYDANRHYDRSPAHPCHVRLTEREPWVCHARMPHWLVRGQDRGNNDFVSGFMVRPGRWTLAQPADDSRL